VDEFDLDEHELTLLREAVRLVDRCDALAEVVDAEGTMTLGPGGLRRAHPALVEARQQQIALARVLAALRLPSGDEAAGRPQKRVGVRGTYAMQSGPSRLRSVS
jgi:hypothetical protein